MRDESRNVLFGVVLGAAFMVCALLIGFRWGAEQIKTADLSVPAPLLFVPK